MNYKKIVAGTLAVTILSLSSVTAYAANTEDLKPINALNSTQQAVPISIKLEEQNQAYFNSFTGVVKEISDFETIKGSKLILVEGADEALANILISDDTYVVNEAEIKIGATITGYYDANAPMLMIYPQRINAEVVSVQTTDFCIQVDRFNKDLISSDNFLKLNISDETEIILQDGTPFKGELANRKLVVLYGVSTRSIPAQTTPSKVVVLFEKAVPVTAPEAMSILVNNKALEAPAAYTNDKGVLMVPLRAISEALGYRVVWDSKLKSVMLDKAISLSIGQDYYTYMKMAPLQLGTAPELVEGKTYVPLQFFKDVAHMNKAEIQGNQIIISNEE